MQLKMVEIYFLNHDMASSDGIITANYLKELLEIQEKLIIKPVRYLTKKHIYPSNLEKMKVRLAVQIFSPLYDILLIMVEKNSLISRIVLQR
jgi:hypothetical protein